MCKQSLRQCSYVYRIDELKLRAKYRDSFQYGIRTTIYEDKEGERWTEKLGSPGVNDKKLTAALRDRDSLTSSK